MINEYIKKKTYNINILNVYSTIYTKKITLVAHKSRNSGRNMYTFNLREYK